MSILRKLRRKTDPSSIRARPEMPITFRAEIMPGKSREERTFRINEVLRNGRITLYEFAGERSKGEFEPVNFQK